MLYNRTVQWEKDHTHRKQKTHQNEWCSRKRSVAQRGDCGVCCVFCLSCCLLWNKLCLDYDLVSLAQLVNHLGSNLSTNNTIKKVNVSWWTTLFVLFLKFPNQMKQKWSGKVLIGEKLLRNNKLQNKTG